MCNFYKKGQDKRGNLNEKREGEITMSMINKEISDFKTNAYHNQEFKIVSKEDILGNMI